jgi:hypothetical protein
VDEMIAGLEKHESPIGPDVEGVRRGDFHTGREALLAELDVIRAHMYPAAAADGRAP